MRTVAALLAISAILVALPLTSAADECTTNAAAAQVCLAIPIGRPSSPSPLPGVPDMALWDTYYLSITPLKCLSPTSNDCAGSPAAEDSGIPMPVGEPVGLGVFGVLWQESNGCSGLQRRSVAPCSQPDRMVLV
jgi:hypothetical protein